MATIIEDEVVEGDALAAPTHAADIERRIGGGKKLSKRVRRVFVLLHRWVSFALLAWVVVISLTGAWLVFAPAFDSWLHRDRFQSTGGEDVGPAAALASVVDGPVADLPEGSHVYSTVLPVNGRGVYQVNAEVPLDTDGLEFQYLTYFVDPGTGEVNGVQDEGEGFSHWMLRGHENLWQEHGILNVFDEDAGWCRRDAGGAEPGGPKGVVCDVIPDGIDMIGWFGVGFFFILASGFYLWYWPNVRRWATALVIKRGRGRFQFHLSLHNVVGLVTLVPLLVISFTGAALAFPNMKSWFENVTPAGRDSTIWEPSEAAFASDEPEAGAEPLDATEVLAAVEEAFPDRTVQVMEGPPEDPTGVWSVWTSKGHDNWTREGAAGNSYVIVDQYTGEIRDDAGSEQGNMAEQLWNDASYPLHAGDFLGTPSRLVWFVVGLSPIVLAVTGVVMWVVRFNRRRRRAAAKAARAAEASSAPDTIDLAEA